MEATWPRRTGRPLTEADLERALEAFAAGEALRGPSVRELQHALGLSSSSLALVRFQRLLKAGYIEVIPGAKYGTRRYRLTRAGRARLRHAVLSEEALEYGRQVANAMALAYGRLPDEELAPYALPESGGGW